MLTPIAESSAVLLSAMVLIPGFLGVLPAVVVGGQAWAAAIESLAAATVASVVKPNSRYSVL